MSAVWGNRVRLTIFGESHGPAVGIVIDGLPPGLKLDMERIAAEMARRAPGGGGTVTARKERDIPEIQSGVKDGVTTGAPLCALIRNEDARSGDYHPSVLRPGHADLTAFYKYKGYADMRGGGHFSGRLTAPLVFAGAIAKQILSSKGIDISARILEIGGVAGEDDMKQAVLAAKADGNSLGGIIEGTITGLPPGLGSPFFGSAESVISAMLFSVPAVKGVEFGDGFALAEARGSEANDTMRIRDGKISLLSNHNGGILGGITNGEPVVVRVAFKPTPTIAREQPSVDVSVMKNAVAAGGGRHDPCVVPRAVPVVEAALALCALELLYDG